MEFQLNGNYMVGRGKSDDGKYDVIPMHCLTNQERIEYKKTHHHYVDFFSREVLKPVREDLKKIYVHNKQNVFNIDSERLVSIGFDGTQAHIGKFKTFESDINLISGTPIYDYETDELISVVTTSKGNKYVIATFGETIAFECTQTEKNMEAFAFEKPISYANKQFNTKDELLEYIKEPDNTNGIAIHYRAKYSNVIFYNAGKTVLQLRFQCGFAGEYHYTSIDKVVLLCFLLSMSHNVWARRSSAVVGNKIDYRNISITASNTLGSLLEYSNKTLKTLNDIQNTQSQLTRELATGELQVRTMQQKLTILQKETDEQKQFLESFEILPNTATILDGVKNNYNKSCIIISTLWNWLSIIETKIHTLYDYDRLIFDIAGKIANSANRHNIQIQHLIGELSTMNIRLVRKRRAVMDITTEREVITRLNLTINYLSQLAGTIEINSHEIDKLVGLSTTNHNSVQIKVPNSHIPAMIFVIFVILLTSRVPSVVMLSLTLFAMILYVEASETVISNADELDSLIAAGVYDFSSEEVEHMHRLIKTCKQGIIVDELTLTMHCKHEHKRHRRGVDDTLNNIKDNVNGFLKNVTQSEIYSKLKAVNVNIKLVFVVIIMYFGITSGYFIITLFAVVLIIFGFDVNFNELQPLIKLLILLAVTFIIFTKAGLVTVLTFLFTIWICFPTVNGGIICNSYLINTLGGYRHQDNSKVVDITRGEIYMKERDCFTWKSNDTANNTHEYIMKLNAIDANIGWIKTKTTPMVLHQRHYINWYENNYITDDDALKLAADNCKMLDRSHVYHRREDRGFWRCGKWYCVVHHTLCVGWTKGSECEVHERSHVESVTIQFTTQKDKEPSHEESFTVKVTETFEVLDTIIKLESIHNYRRDTIRIVCGNTTYHIADTFYWPHEVIVSQVSGKVDWKFYDRYLSFSDDSFTSGIKTLFTGVPQNTLTDVTKDLYTFKADSIAFEITVSGVVNEMGKCNYIMVDLKGILVRMMTYEVTAQLRVLVARKTPCSVEFSLLNSTCCTMTDHNYIILNYKPIKIVMMCQDDCNVTIVYNNKKLDLGKVPPMSVWSFMNMGGIIVSDIISGNNNGFFGDLFSGFNVGNILNNKVIKVLVISILVYVVFSANSTLGIFMGISLYFMWNVVSANDEIVVIDDTLTQFLLIILIMISCGYVNVMVLSRVRQLELSNVNPILIGLKYLIAWCVVISDYMEAYMIIHLFLFYLISKLIFGWLLMYNVSKLYLKLMNKFAQKTATYFKVHVILFDFSNLLYILSIDDIISGNINAWSVIQIFFCCFLKVFRIHIIGCDITCVFHWLLPKNFLHDMDIFATDTGLLCAYRGDFTSSLDKCIQVDYNDEEQCPIHAGKSGTFGELGLINESIKHENHFFCGYTRDPMRAKVTIKNILIHQEIEQSASQQLDDIALKVDNDETKQIVERINALTMQNREFAVGMQVDYSLLDYGSIVIGNKEYFKSSTTTDAVCPIIYSIRHGNTVGFAFNFQGAVFTSYHITKGAPLVLPIVGRDGKSNKVVLMAIESNETQDYVIYGKTGRLSTPVEGARYMVANPKNQQFIILKYDKVVASCDSTKSYSFVREVMCEDLKLHNYNVFSKFGWSGLPILDMQTGLPVGVYGLMREDSMGNSSVRVSTGLGATEIVNWQQRAKDILNSPFDRIHEITAPTGSGKSTMFPLHLANQFILNNKSGLIIVCNPLRAVPIDLRIYLMAKIVEMGLSDKIVVHHSIGGDTSYSSTAALNKSGQVCILYITYGKYLSEFKHHKPRVVILDEIHTEQPAVMLTREVLQHRIEKSEIRYHVCSVTATPRDVASVMDRTFDEMALRPVDPKEYRNYVFVENDLYINPNDIIRGIKALVFCSSKRVCEDSAMDLRKKSRGLVVVTYYSDHKDGMSSINKFNANDTVVMFVTNAVESGITLIGCNTVYDTRLEYVEELYLDETRLVQRIIDKKSYIQRRGRAGRTSVGGAYYFPANTTNLVNKHDISNISKYNKASLALFQCLRNDDLDEETIDAISEINRLWSDQGSIETVAKVLAYSDVNPFTLRAMCQYDQQKQKYVIASQYYEIAFKRVVDAERVPFKAISDIFFVDPEITVNENLHYALTIKEMNSALNNVVTGGVAVATVVVGLEVLASVCGLACAEEIYIAFNGDWKVFMAHLYGDFFFAYFVEDVKNSKLDCIDAHKMHEVYLLNRLPTTAKPIVSNQQVGQVAIVAEKGVIAFRLVIDNSGLVNRIADTTVNIWDKVQIDINETVYNMDSIASFFAGLVERNSIVSTYPLIEQLNAWIVTVASGVGASAGAIMPLPFWASLGLAGTFDQMVVNMGPSGALAVVMVASGLLVTPSIVLPVALTSLLTYGVKRMIIGGPLDALSNQIPAYPMALLVGTLGGAAINHMVSANIYKPQMYKTLTGNYIDVNIANGSIVIVTKHIIVLARKIIETINSDREVDVASLSANVIALASEVGHLSVHQILIVIVAAVIVSIIVTSCRSNSHYIHTLLSTVIKDSNKVDELMREYTSRPDDVIEVGLCVACYIVSPTSVISSVFVTLNEMIKTWMVNEPINVRRAIHKGIIDGAGVPVWLSCFQVLGDILIRWKHTFNSVGSQNNSMIAMGGGVISSISGLVYLMKNKECMDTTMNAFVTAGNLIKKWVAAVWAILAQVINYIISIFQGECLINPYELISDIDGCDILAPMEDDKRVRLIHMLCIDPCNVDMVLNDIKPVMTTRRDKILHYIQLRLSSIPQQLINEEPVMVCEHKGIKQIDMMALTKWVKTINNESEIQIFRKIAGICKDPLFCYSTQINDDGLTIFIYGKHTATMVEFALVIHVIGNIILLQVHSLVKVNVTVMSRVRENVFSEGIKLVSAIMDTSVTKRGISRRELMSKFTWFKNLQFAVEDNRPNSYMAGMLIGSVASLWKNKKSTSDKALSSLTVEIDKCDGLPNVNVNFGADGVEMTMRTLNELVDCCEFIDIDDIHDTICNHSTSINDSNFSICFLSTECSICLKQWALDVGHELTKTELSETKGIQWYASYKYASPMQKEQDDGLRYLIEHPEIIEKVDNHVKSRELTLGENYDFNTYCKLITDPVIINSCTFKQIDRACIKAVGMLHNQNKLNSYIKFQNVLATLLRNSIGLPCYESVLQYVSCELTLIKQCKYTNNIRDIDLNVSCSDKLDKSCNAVIDGDNEKFDNLKLQLNAGTNNFFLTGIMKHWRIENSVESKVEGQLLNLMTESRNANEYTNVFLEGQPHLHLFKPKAIKDENTDYCIASYQLDLSLLKTHKDNINGVHVIHELPGLEGENMFYILADADKYFKTFHSYKSVEGQVSIGRPREGTVTYIDIESGHDILCDLKSSHIYSNKPFKVDKSSYLADINDITGSVDLMIIDVDKFRNDLILNDNLEAYLVFKSVDVVKLIKICNKFKQIGFFAPNCISNDSDTYVVYVKHPDSNTQRDSTGMILNFLKEVNIFRNNCIVHKIRKLPSHFYPLKTRDSNKWIPLTHGRIIKRKQGDLDLDRWAFGAHQAKPFLHVPACTLMNKHDTLLPLVKSKLKIKELDCAIIQREFAHQRVLMAYTKSDRLQQDRTMLNNTISTLAMRTIEWHPMNSAVVQCSKDKAKVFESIQTRLDQPIAYIHDEVMQELYECAETMRTTKVNDLQPYSYEQALELINRQGAAGIFEDVSNMADRLGRATTRDMVMNLIMKLKNGEACVEAIANCHHKVESKVGKHSVDGQIVHTDIDLYRPPPRLITYFDTIWRIVDWMVFGPYVKHHMDKEKLYHGSTSGMPIFEVGDYLKKWWDDFEDVAAATGDACKWDHSMGVQLIILECQWVKSHYKEEWWPLIEAIYMHVIWPLVFNRLGFCMTVTGHRLSGWILTWHNGFIDSLLHARAWKKVLKLPMSTPMTELYKLVWTGCDGDDNVHIGSSKYVNEKNMAKVEYYMAQCNIKIRSGNHSGYRIHSKLETVDYLSHTYAPIQVKGVEKWLPVRPLTEIIGKLCYTIKQAATGNQIAKGKEGKIFPIRPQDVITPPKTLKDLEKTEVKDKSSEGLLIETSKVLSYLLLYPHIPYIRIFCLTIMAILGCPGDIKFLNNYRFKTKFGKVKIEPGKGIRTVQHAIYSIYGCTLDEIGYWNMDTYCDEMRKHYKNVITAFRAFPEACKKLQISKIVSWLNLDDRKFKIKHNIMAISYRCMKEGFKMLNTNGIESYPYPEYFAISRATKRMWNRSFHMWTMPLFDDVDNINDEIKQTPLYNEGNIINKVESMFNYIVSVIKSRLSNNNKQLNSSIQIVGLWIVMATTIVIAGINDFKNRKMFKLLDNRINSVNNTLVIILVIISFINMILVDVEFTVKILFSMPFILFVGYILFIFSIKKSYLLRIVLKLERFIVNRLN